MSDPDFAVLGIGNALVDVISSVDDEFITAHDFPRGATTMVDLERAEAVYADLPPAQEISGGLVRQHDRRPGVVRRHGRVRRTRP